MSTPPALIESHAIFLQSDSIPFPYKHSVIPFLYKPLQMKPPAETILEASKGLLKQGEVIYIATDERDKSFFAPFLEDHT